MTVAVIENKKGLEVALFNARVGEEGKLLADIISVEKSRLANRYDAKNKLSNFEVILSTVGKSEFLNLRHLKTGKDYRLTNVAISNLFSKLSYVPTKERSKVGNNFVNLIPANLQRVTLDTYNSSKAVKFRVNSLQEIKDTLFNTVSKLPKNLKVQILNHAILTQKVSTETFQMKFQKVGNTSYIRCILDEKYKNFSNVDLLENLQNFLDTNKQDWKVVRYVSDVLGNDLQIRITKKFNQALAKGEPVEYALSFSNSETGCASVRGEVGLYVLKCTNGMTALDEGGSFELVHNRSDKDTFINAVRHLLSNGTLIWEKIQKRYDLSKEIIIPNAEDLINSVCIDYDLGKKVSEQIMNEYKKDLAKDGKPTLFKVVDVFTEASHRFYNMSQQGFSKLENLGSDILMNTEKFLSAINN